MNRKKIITGFICGIFLCLQCAIINPTQATVSFSDEEITPATFSPDGNGLNDTITISLSSTASQTLYLNVFYNGTQLIRGDISMTESPAGSYRGTWNGKDYNNSYVTQEGVYTIRVTDVLGGGSGVSVGTVTVDLTTPTSVSLSIDGGASSTTTRSVNLTISATGATKMKVSNYANFSGATWETYATSKQWQLTESDGSKTVYINFRDAAGTNVSTSDSITLDSSLNTPSLSINNGASTTSSLTVDLSITASDATYMKIDNNTGFENMSSWITKSSTYTFTLPSGSDGSRTVYLRVKDDAGNIKTTSDSITVDTQAPTSLSLSINSGASYTNNQTVTLTLSASGGPETIWLSNNQSSWSSFDYTTSLSWNLSSTDGTKTVYYKAADAAGNNATAISATIILDTLDPTQVTLTSPDAGASISSQEPTFSWTNPNQVSKTRQFKIEILQSGTVKQSSYTNVTTRNYTATTLAEGSYTWRVTVYDLANNSATTSQRSFTISVSGLAIPSPTYPTSAARVNDTTPRLRWSQVSGQGTIYYDYKYGNSSSNLTNTGSTTSLYVDVTTHEHADVIYWAVRARNTTSQSNYSTVRYFTIDTQEPILNSISINSGDTYSTSRNVTLTLNATGASWMKLSEYANFSGASWVAYSTSKTFTLSSTNGEKTIYFIAKDNAVGDQGSNTYANVNTTALSSSITLDTEAPSISSPVPSAGGSTTTTSNLPIQATLSDTGSGINTSAVTLVIDNASVTPVVSQSKVQYTASTISEGTHTVNLTVYDNVSHVSFYNWSFTVSSSETPSDGPVAPPAADAAPVITDISFTPTSPTSAETILISATVIDDVGVESVDVIYEQDGTYESTSMAAEENSTTYTANIGPFSGGSTVSFYISAMDISPQVTQSSIYNITIQSDTTAPVITIVSPESDATITDQTPLIKVTFTDEDGINVSSIKLTVDSVDVTDSATTSETLVSYTPTIPLSFTKHTVLVSVADTQGNSATKTWQFTVTAKQEEVTETIDEIKENETKTLFFNQSSMHLQQIQLTAKETLTNISITVSTTQTKPSYVSAPAESIYLYLIINSSAPSDSFANAVISFRVEQEWFIASNINKSDVILIHESNGKWETLETKQTTEDDNYVYYEASTSGFSVFAITSIEEPEPILSFPWIFILIGVFVVVALMLIVVFWYRRNE